MKIILEATVAVPGEVLADGMVRVNVTIENKLVGRLNLKSQLWEWIKKWVTADWAIMALDFVFGNGDITEWEIKEVAHDPKAYKPTSMRGEFLQAVQERVSRKQLYCSVCKEPQRETPSGLVCANGHGGASSVEGELELKGPRVRRGVAPGRLGELWKQTKKFEGK